jgi:hypothetical protein
LEVVKAVVPPLSGVKVQVISFNHPAFQVMVLPLTVAGRSLEPIRTDVPSPLIENDTLMVPKIPWLIVPDQVPANLAGPVMAGFCRGSLAVVVFSDFGFTDRFHFGAEDCCGAGVGLSGASTIGAGDRRAATQSNRITIRKPRGL